MATLKEYYKKDMSRHLKVSAEMNLSGDGETHQIVPEVHFDFDSNAKFISLYIPTGVDALSCSVALLNTVKSILKRTEDVIVQSGYGPSTDPPAMDSRDLVFTGRVYLYSDEEMPAGRWQELKTKVQDIGLYPILRTSKYAEWRQSLEQPLAFICHDSRDKDRVASKIANQLQRP